MKKKIVAFTVVIVMLAIAIVGGKAGEPISEFCPPCGVCRQVMREFCDDDFIIVLSNGEEIKEHKLSEILPVSFSPKDVR